MFAMLRIFSESILQYQGPIETLAKCRALLKEFYLFVTLLNTDFYFCLTGASIW